MRIRTSLLIKIKNYQAPQANYAKRLELDRNLTL